jgi:E3 ubiquitin-protein ligase synoviolin
LFIHGLFLQYAVGVTLARGPSVLLYFGFEYVILASATVSTVVKYALYSADSLVDNRWENKVRTEHKYVEPDLEV